ncbi:MAG: hypothetical protein ACK4UJ_11790 [Leptonema sp. (in: bacteria)]
MIFPNNLLYSNIFLIENHLQTRVGSTYFYKENFSSSISRKEQTLLIFGEYTFRNIYSIYLGIPYTFKWTENSDTRKYLDFIRIINKFQFYWSPFYFYTGLLLDLPRKHNQAGDVPKDFGYIEPYMGISYKKNSFSIKFSAHWNTQTNTKFKEEKNQEFVRRWFLNLSMGYFFRNWLFWIESQYQQIYDPKALKNNYFLYGPAFGYKTNHFEISLVYLIYPKDFLYDKEIGFQLQKFIDF